MPRMIGRLSPVQMVRFAQFARFALSIFVVCCFRKMLIPLATDMTTACHPSWMRLHPSGRWCRKDDHCIDLKIRERTGRVAFRSLDDMSLCSHARATQEISPKMCNLVCSSHLLTLRFSTRIEEKYSTVLNYFPFVSWWPPIVLSISRKYAVLCIVLALWDDGCALFVSKSMMIKIDSSLLASLDRR